MVSLANAGLFHLSTYFTVHTNFGKWFGLIPYICTNKEK